MLRLMFFLYVFLKFFLFLIPFSRGLDTISLGMPISDDGLETIVSTGRVFELGFFSPGASDSRRYVGIWYYNISPLTVVWIVNRHRPLNDKSGVFGFGVNGNLELSSGASQGLIWSTELQAANRTLSSNRTAKLTDSGNLVLSKFSEDGKKETLWQSFDHPTDTFLPGMAMNGEDFKLTSWKGPGDPSPGNFSFLRDQDREDQYIIQTMDNSLHWKSGISWKLVSHEETPTISSILKNFSSNIDQRRNVTVARLMIGFDGKIKYLTCNRGSKKWQLQLSEPRDRCHEYNACGDFGICNMHEPMCRCLSGFKPQDDGDLSQGCTRTSHLCGDDMSATTFQRLKLINIGAPATRTVANNQKECHEQCVGNCKCLAYSYTVNQSTPTGKCWIWTEDLNNIQEGTVNAIDVYVWPPKPDSSKKGISKYILYLIAISVLVVAVGTLLFMWRRSVNRRERGGTTPENLAFHSHGIELQIKQRMGSDQMDDGHNEGINVPFISMQDILKATNYLSDQNKLGEGGFGPVYKGTFPGGQEIAVKRLSSGSGQGLEEFKNEVQLIAKLQHRNLVKLLGYCTKGDEKLLVYEYMPNKSLDSFIFDRTRCVLLNWQMRMEIISGIARGMLYLHQDSRLRVIHRDLKASNVLLDEEMNPKISDFGLARIFQVKQTEARTNRVIGTLGYMSPEYALDGFFSVKSDVFSFGVLVLEIISGKRNTGFYQSKIALNLLSYAWRLWNEDKAMDLIDHTLHETCDRDEALKCIKLALLCVQTDPGERPTMSNIAFTLSHDNVNIPTPKQPAFVVEKVISSEASTSSGPESYYEITDSLEQGR